MAIPSSKIAPFPGYGAKRTTPPPMTDAGNDPTSELRSYIEGLQTEARIARTNQEAAEEDRDRLAEEVRRMQREMEAANEARQSNRAVVVERDNLRAELEKNDALMVEARRKSEAADRMRIQAESQRDQAMEVVKTLRQESEKLVTSRDEANRQKEAALRQRAQLQRDRDEAALRVTEMQRALTELQRALVEADASKSRDSEVQKQLLSIRQARDSAAKQAAELKVQIGELEDQIAELIYDREVSDKAAKKAVIEADAMRVQLEADTERVQMLEMLKAELAEVNEELTAVRQQHASLQGAKDQLVAQLREFRETHEAMLINNSSQTESAIKERDVLKTRLQERENELKEVRAELAAAWSGAMQVTEPEIERLTKELASMKERAAAMNTVVSQSEDLARQREDMRLQVIELNAMLENARREIKEIGAQLAEARLQLKLAGKNAMVQPPTRQEPVAPATFGIDVVMPSRIEAFQKAWLEWVGQGENAEPTWDLAREAAAYAGSCQAGGQHILHRISGRVAGAIESMVEDPSSATPRFRNVVGKAIELLAQLETQSELDHKVRLTGARVYLVDDDSELCELSAELLGAAGFAVDSTQHSAAAIAHLSETPYDLILLDVRLPEVDGFELCGYIRGMELHHSTPIVFVTGTEMDDPSIGGPEFVAKPFAPGELVLRSMIAVVKSQLEKA